MIDKRLNVYGADIALGMADLLRSCLMRLAGAPPLTDGPDDAGGDPWQQPKQVADWKDLWELEDDLRYRMHVIELPNMALPVPAGPVSPGTTTDSARQPTARQHQRGG